MKEDEAQAVTDNAEDEATLPADELRGLLEQERERAQSYLTSWQRERADFQNFKRRTEQDKSEYQRLANLALVLNILPAADDLQRALENVDPNVAGENWVEGIRQIQRKFDGALQASGVIEIAAQGEPFDPAKHEAIGQAPGDPDTVVRVLQRGYTMGDRVIRPAMVMVGDGTEA